MHTIVCIQVIYIDYYAVLYFLFFFFFFFFIMIRPPRRSPLFPYTPLFRSRAAATTALLAEGRFTLGVGAGERLNEHVVGQGWPAVGTRHEMFRESLEIIRLLWSGGYHSYEGKHLILEDARVFDLPQTQPRSEERRVG